MHADGDLPADVPLDQLVDQYITAVKKGILKTMSKMGISTLRSYHAAQQFEAVGLDRDVVDKYFTGTASRIEGVGLDVIAREALARHRVGLRPPRAGAWNWISAASTTSASTARTTSGTRPPSPASSTP